MKKVLFLYVFCLISYAVSFGQNDVREVEQNHPTDEKIVIENLEDFNCRHTLDKECRQLEIDKISFEPDEPKGEQCPTTLPGERPDPIDVTRRPIDEPTRDYRDPDRMFEIPVERIMNPLFDCYLFDLFGINESAEFPCFPK